MYGFGNLRGNIEIWDMKKRKLVRQIMASDSTYLEWSPDGIHFCTATTAPRLQVGNGYVLLSYLCSYIGFRLKWLWKTLKVRRGCHSIGTPHPHVFLKICSTSWIAFLRWSTVLKSVVVVVTNDGCSARGCLMSIWFRQSCCYWGFIWIFC